MLRPTPTTPPPAPMRAVSWFTWLAISLVLVGFGLQPTPALAASYQVRIVVELPASVGDASLLLRLGRAEGLPLNREVESSRYSLQVQTNTRSATVIVWRGGREERRDYLNWRAYDGQRTTVQLSYRLNEVLLLEPNPPCQAQGFVAAVTCEAEPPARPAIDNEGVAAGQEPNAAQPDSPANDQPAAQTEPTNPDEEAYGYAKASASPSVASQPTAGGAADASPTAEAAGAAEENPSTAPEPSSLEPTWQLVRENNWAAIVAAPLFAIFAAVMLLGKARTLELGQRLIGRLQTFYRRVRQSRQPRQNGNRT